VGGGDLPVGLLGVSISWGGTVASTDDLFGFGRQLGERWTESSVPRTTDPREIGCRCDECPLGKKLRSAGQFRPVMPEIQPRRPGEHRLLIVGEAPGAVDVQDRYPFSGRNGDRLTDLLMANQWTRTRASITHALLCRPPDNNIDLVMAESRREIAQTKRDAKKLKAAGIEPDEVGITPLEACHPHLQRLVEAHDYVLAFGAVPTRSILGISKRIRAVRGSFLEYDRIKLGSSTRYMRSDAVRKTDLESDHTLRMVVTYSPAFVLHKPAYQPMVAHDIGRLKRWMEGRLDWPDNLWLIRNPSPAQLERWLFGPDAPRDGHGVDVETDGKESLTCNLRSITFSGSEGGMVVHFRSLDGKILLGDDPMRPGFYRSEEAKQIRALIRRFLGDPKRMKWGQNWYYFDEQVLQREVGIGSWPDPAPVTRGLFDTVVGSRAENSEINRDLYTIATRLTDVRESQWKEDHEGKKLALAVKTDFENAEYNNRDGVITKRSGLVMLPRVIARKQLDVVKLDHQKQAVYREMHALGLHVDEPARQAMEDELTERVFGLRETLRDLIGDGRFNPLSIKQMHRLFFEDLRLPVVETSEKTGLPTLDDTAILAYRRMAAGEDQRIVDICDTLRSWRKQRKELSTYVLPLRLQSDLRKTRTGKLVGGLTDPRTGRIHPHYSAHAAATGRGSASSPGVHQIPKHLRKLFIPGPGNAFSGADYDQIELRLVSAVAGAEAYLVVFRNGGDPHATTAILIYGDVFVRELRASLTAEQWARFQATGSPVKADHGTKLYESLRRFAKTFVYAVIYGGTAKTIFEGVSTAEDPKTGKLLFPNMTLDDVRLAYDSWMRNAPQIPKWWAEVERECTTTGKVAEPIMGRVRDFPEWDRNEAMNMPIQGGAAIIHTRGLIRLRKAFPPDFTRYRGLVFECHDATCIEHPDTAQDARLAREKIEEAMYQRYFDVDFNATAATGYTLADV